MKLLVPVLFTILLAGTVVALPPPSAIRAGRLIKQLGANDYFEREAATKALQRMGKAALPALRVACAHKDAEIRKRARRLVDVLTPVQPAYGPPANAFAELARVHMKEFALHAAKAKR